MEEAARTIGILVMLYEFITLSECLWLMQLKEEDGATLRGL